MIGTLTNPTTTGATTTNIFLSDSTAIGSALIAVNHWWLVDDRTYQRQRRQRRKPGHYRPQHTGRRADRVDPDQCCDLKRRQRPRHSRCDFNRLTAASNVINSQVQNLTSAENTITAADIPTVVANLTKYSILEQTGISALAQANQQQQLVLKLLQ